ncbi:hypothetical protein KKE45_01365 [Patescibacteria group bacterium]|nr:hypothetical protein [Patescibacteria group bacterium]
MEKEETKRVLREMGAKHGDTVQTYFCLHTLTEPPSPNTKQKQLAYQILRATFSPAEIARGKKAWNATRITPR